MARNIGISAMGSMRYLGMAALLQTAACAQMTGIEEPINIEENTRSFTLDASGNFVKDNVTGLKWDISVTSAMSLDDAKMRCASASTWRVPALAELESIVDHTVGPAMMCKSSESPVINCTFFPDTPLASFWTSSLVATDQHRAWIVDFNDGYASSRDVSDMSHYVRCVHSDDSEE